MQVLVVELVLEGSHEQDEADAFEFDGGTRLVLWISANRMTRR